MGRGKRGQDGHEYARYAKQAEVVMAMGGICERPISKAWFHCLQRSVSGIFAALREGTSATEKEAMYAVQGAFRQNIGFLKSVRKGGKD
jgi:hypothetical protein